MKASFFALLGLSFPNADIRLNFGAELRDRNGKLIGYVYKEEFVLNEDYEHYQLAKEALEKNGVAHRVQSGVEGLYG